MKSTVHQHLSMGYKAGVASTPLENDIFEASDTFLIIDME